MVGGREGERGIGVSRYYHLIRQRPWFDSVSVHGGLHRKCFKDFPGGAVVKNLPANAGDTGSSPGPGRSHMPWSN